MTQYDVAIIGAGIAGASLAAELAPHMAVLLIEAEAQPGYHATGRSNAFWHQTYGGPLIEPLTSASRDWLRSSGFLHKRGALTLARGEDQAALDRFVDGFAGSGVMLQMLDRAALLARVPGLRPEWDRGVYEDDCHDIDVAAYHAGCLRTAKHSGAVLVTNARLERALRKGGEWRLATRAGDFTAGLIVNAAGAWANDIAQMAGATLLGVQPYRRTITQLSVDYDVPVDLPLVIDINGDFYFKPESGRVWLSPHDESATPPCDAAPEEYDIALAIDRFERVVDWPVRRVEHSWAGLRSFAPDRLPIYGFDTDCTGFFWCAGQGGFGIQTAPAAAKLASALLMGTTPDPMIAGIDPTRYAPGRFGDGII
jgi:D-arginine dehydrogenase